jgi:GDP-L-fucose synthase
MAEAYRRQYGCDYISAMPTNLYGTFDNFDLKSSHVLPALIRKAHEAKLRGDDKLVIWGTGTPRREFLHVDDCADALVFLMCNYSDARHVNVGSGEDIAIGDLAELVAKVVGFKGIIERDASKPDGTPRKLMDNARLRGLGWQPTIALEDGIRSTYEWFLGREIVS